MRLRKAFAALLLLVVIAAQAQSPMEMPLPLDKDVRIGKLDNGLTYYIRHNNWPEHRANFYIAQKVGSIQEEESQRGLAHFLEHMCFNGSKHFEGNNVMRWCESIGVQFGSELNAYTGIDQTVYNIDNVPTARQSVLDSCLLILSDWAGNLTLDPKEIDEERGVIHEEWRMRSGASSRLFERNLPALYPGSKYGVRFPIGLMSVVDNFKPKELRDYYEKWYHPSNQGIIVIGDVDVDHIEAKIKELFGSYTNPKDAAPVVAEPVPDNAEPIVIIDQDKELDSNEIEIFIKHEAMPDSLKNTVMYLLQQYVTNAATYMLNQRLTEVAQDATCPFVSAGVSDGEYIMSKTVDAFTLSIAPKDLSLSNNALQAAFTELRRAAEFGFTESEYSRFQDTYTAMLDKAYSNRDKRTNAHFYEECKANFLEGVAMPGIDTEYMMMKQLVPMLPVEAINEAMKEYVPENDSNLVVISFNTEKEGAVYPTKEGLLGAIKAARTADISAYVDNVKNEPLMTTLPKAGKIVKETKNAQLGYTTLTLSNGATVILKKTDYKKDQVLLSAEGYGAQSLYGPKDYTNLTAFDDIIGVSGLGNFSSTELHKALAGKVANVDLTMGNLYTQASGSSTPKDMQTMFQMLYLYFTAINKDQKAFDNQIEQYKLELKNRDLVAEKALSDSLTATMYGHNPRLAPMTIDRLNDISYDRILQIAKERTANAAAWTFEFVGNFEEDSIRPLICQYIASLPAKKKFEKSKRTINLVNGNVENIFQRKQETPKCTAYIYWHNENIPYNLTTNVQADMAGQILSMIYLKKIREEASAAYSCGAFGNAHISDDNYHSVAVIGVCPMKPEKKDLAMKIMNEEIEGMAKTIDADMFAKVKEFLLKQYDDVIKTNDYWTTTIYTYRKYGIDEYTDYRKTVEAQTPESLAAFMKTFLSAGNKVTVMMTPEE